MSIRTPLDEQTLAVDEQLAQVSETFRFLLDLTPVDAARWRRRWLDGEHETPQFSYRPLSTDPDVVQPMLQRIELDHVGSPTVRELLAHKHRELWLQAEMLRARNTADFLPLSVELYGGVTPELRELAKQVLERVPQDAAAVERVDAGEFHAMALEEIAWYQAQDPDVVMHAEVRHDVNGVMVGGDTLLIGADSQVQSSRSNALLQHEIGTHLVTQVNGGAQQIRCLGTGLAGYDETQEGLAVLGEIACGQLTATRLRQLAGRVLTVDALVGGASLFDCWQQLVSRGFKRGSAFTTVMRIHRSGGFTKDACYLRGLVDLLAHLADGGRLDLFYLGKFSLADLALVEVLDADGHLAPARISPRYLVYPQAAERLAHAATAPLHELVEHED